MPEEQWSKILTQIDPKLISKPFSPSLISSVRSEVRSRYEETIRKANSKPQTESETQWNSIYAVAMTLLKPSVKGAMQEILVKPDPV